MPVRVGGRGEHFGEELLAAGVAVEHAVLPALLVVEDELHGHPGIARPVGKGRLAAVADEVAGVGWGGLHGVLLRQPSRASRRKRAMRPICSRQVRNSVARSFFSRASTASDRKSTRLNS